MMTDFHTHILPGVDDGSRSVEMSVQMLESMAKQGITRVVATPHFYAQVDSPKAFLERRTAAVSELQAAMEGVPKLPKLSVGAEVHFFTGCLKLIFLSKPFDYNF